MFRNLIDDNSRQSARLEPGCLRFDVVEPHGDEDMVLLYEIYRDRAAFEAHLRSEHYARFDASSAGLTDRSGSSNPRSGLAAAVRPAASAAS